MVIFQCTQQCTQQLGLYRTLPTKSPASLNTLASTQRSDRATGTCKPLNIIQKLPTDEFVLIEGVGGVGSPIASLGLNIDLIVTPACRAILVATL
jgi:dethiobiotin synthetase